MPSSALCRVQCSDIFNITKGWSDIETLPTVPAGAIIDDLQSSLGFDVDGSPILSKH